MMARIANLQERRERQTGQIWQRLIDYANGDGSEKEFKALAVDCFDRMGIEDAANTLKQCKDVQTHTPAELADRYREPIRNVMRWLIGPESFSIEQMDSVGDFMTQATDAVRFLNAHAQAYRVEYNPMVEINEETTQSTVLMYRSFSHIGSVITGICHFILEQINRHDLNGEPITDVFPFGLCGRTGCGRFFIVQRTGRARFCSDNCRSLVGKAKKSKAEKAAYMKQYRAAKALEASRAERARLRKAR